MTLPSDGLNPGTIWDKKTLMTFKSADISRFLLLAGLATIFLISQSLLAQHAASHESELADHCQLCHLDHNGSSNLDGPPSPADIPSASNSSPQDTEASNAVNRYLKPPERAPPFNTVTH